MLLKLQSTVQYICVVKLKFYGKKIDPYTIHYTTESIKRLLVTAII